MSNKKNFASAFMLALAALASVATLVTVVWHPNEFSVCCKIVYFIAILVGCLLYAILSTRKKSKIKLCLGDNLSVVVKKGSVLTDVVDDSNIVIHMNEYFDTIVDNYVISKYSLHGKFIETFYNDRVEELDEKIKKEIESERYTPIVSGVFRKHGGKPDKYNIGDCLKIREGKNSYILMAFTHFDEDDHAFLSKTEYVDALDKLFSFLSKKTPNKPIYMGLLGTGLSRLNKSPQFMLVYLLQTLMFLKSENTPNEINILIDKEQFEKINLNEVENIFRT